MVPYRRVLNRLWGPKVSHSEAECSEKKWAIFSKHLKVKFNWQNFLRPGLRFESWALCEVFKSKLSQWICLRNVKIKYLQLSHYSTLINWLMCKCYKKMSALLTGGFIKKKTIAKSQFLSILIPVKGNCYLSFFLLLLLLLLKFWLWRVHFKDRYRLAVLNHYSKSFLMWFQCKIIKWNQNHSLDILSCNVIKL